MDFENKAVINATKIQVYQSLKKAIQKFMKKVVFLLLIIVSGFLTSCETNDDHCSQGDVWVGLGLIQKDAGSGSYIIAMDDGEILYPANADTIWPGLKNHDRVLTNFVILGNKDNPNHDEQYYVEIYSLRKILYKGILDITPAIEDSIGNDPISVKDHWLKNDMLNFELQYFGGSKVHYINLVKKPGVINLENGPVILELRHKTNGDNEQFPLSAMVTFDMSSLKVAGKTSTPYKIIAKGFDGHDFEFSGEYKY